jgi:hypothetical protein
VGAGGDDGGLGLDDALADLEPAAIEKLGVTVDQVVLVHLVGGVGQHQVDEGVAQVAHMLQGCLVVDLEVLSALDAVAPEPLSGLVGVGEMDRDLRRHTADPGAGGSEGTAIDQDPTIGDPADLFDGVQAGVARTDDGDIDFDGHGRPPRKGIQSDCPRR